MEENKTPEKIALLTKTLNNAKTFDDAFAVYFTMLENKYTEEEIHSVLNSATINKELLELIDEQEEKSSKGR